MSIKIALCDDHQPTMTQVQALIQAHPQSALFQVNCFATARELLAQSVAYDLLITDIEKAPGDINGFELAGQIDQNTKIIILSNHDPAYIFSKMRHYEFELFDSIEKKAQAQIIQALDEYLAWRKNPQQHFPLLFKRTPSPRPSITLKTPKKTEVTLCYDDILSLTHPFFSLIPQVIITTREGKYKITDYFGLLTQIGQQPQFYLRNHGQYLLNLDHCAFSLKNKTLALMINDEPIKKFKLSHSECQILFVYFIGYT